MFLSDFNAIAMYSQVYFLVSHPSTKDTEIVDDFALLVNEMLCNVHTVIM